MSPSRTGTPFIPRRLPILRVRAFYSPWYGYSFSESRGPTTEGHVPLFRGTLSPPLRGTVVPRFKGTGSNFGRSCTPLPWEAWSLCERTGPEIRGTGARFPRAVYPLADYCLPFSDRRGPLFRDTGEPLFRESSVRKAFSARTMTPMSHRRADAPRPRVERHFEVCHGISWLQLLHPLL